MSPDRAVFLSTIVVFSPTHLSLIDVCSDSCFLLMDQSLKGWRLIKIVSIFLKPTLQRSPELVFDHAYKSEPSLIFTEQMLVYNVKVRISVREKIH